MVVLRNTSGLGESEFSGGSLTGPLLSMADVGALLFVLTAIVAFRYSRFAAIVGLASCVLCLPLYLFFIAPLPFNRIFGFGHEFKTQPIGGLNWWAMGGVLTLAITAYICVTALRSPGGLRLNRGDD